MSDIVERLRNTAVFIANATGKENSRWVNDAAEEIERLREAFNRLWQPSAIVKPATKTLTDWQQDQAETTRILRKRVGDDPS